MSKIHFLAALHEHQPVGNFDTVFHEACSKAYKPFLDELQRHPKIRITLHYSGSLLEWIEFNRQDIIHQMREMVKAGQLEIMGGAYYEPIMAMLPDRDKIGQIRMYVDHLQELFQTRVRGLWLPERVWEQCLTRPLVDAGIEYTVLDDTHFKYAGLNDDQLNGYYVTEDCGRVLRLFAGSEKLRYYIPFADPWKTTEYLGQMNAATPDAIAVYADDGEKFGIWPETFKHVYTNGWLGRFFDELDRNVHWIDFATFSEVIDRFPPKGRIYLPDASYREMTEWALPATTLVEYEEAVEELQRRDLFDRVRRFMRGGFWRNFKVKYPESNLMYSKMMHVSNKVEAIRQENPAAYERSRRELYRGQCNCAWWHGVFGGLYLPHLRHAMYEHLIAAEQIVDSAGGRNRLDVEEFDFDMDLAGEVYLGNDRLTAVVKPSRGGHLIELDSRTKNVNLLGGLSRRFEAYHKNVVAPPPEVAPSDVKSIHHIVKSKEEGLGKLLRYDWYPREGFIDHFFMADTTIESMMNCEFVERADFVLGWYQHTVKPDERQISIELHRDGTVWVNGSAHPVRLEKTFRFPRAGSQIECTYRITAGAPLDIIFAPEMNLAFPGKDPDVWNYRLKGERNAGKLEGLHSFENQDEAGVNDKMKSMDICLHFSSPASIWLYPIRTVSQSEGGFEHVFQSCAIVPRWPLHLEPNHPWEVTVTLVVVDR